MRYQIWEARPTDWDWLLADVERSESPVEELGQRGAIENSTLLSNCL